MMADLTKREPQKRTKPLGPARHRWVRHWMIARGMRCAASFPQRWPTSTISSSFTRRATRVEDRALHIVEDEAEFVRSLFRRYLEVGSVVRLKTALDAENLRSPIRTSRSGRRSGGNPMSRGHLYWILSNPIYVGRLRHKGQIHDGLHPAIADLETWTRVRQKLESQTRARRMSQPDDHSFLAGKLYDDRGNRMSASHASKGGRRWALPTAWPSMPSADFCIRGQDALRRPQFLSWNAEQTSRGKFNRLPCAVANLRFASLMNMDFAISRPLVQRSRLISGSCPSTRTFAPRFL